MDTNHLIRQSDLIPSETLDTSITIIGAGAIGGWTALSLAKMGMNNLTVYDFDKVEEENLNSQFYSKDDLNKPKVECLQRWIEMMSGIKINTITDKYIKQPIPSKIIISAVDQMYVRKDIFDNNHGGVSEYLIDPRMGAENALLYVVDLDSDESKDSYRNTFYSDDEAVQEPCTAKATIYTASLLSGLVCKAVKDIITANPFTKMVQWNIKNNECLMFGSQDTA